MLIKPVCTFRWLEGSHKTACGHSLSTANSNRDSLRCNLIMSPRNWHRGAGSDKLFTWLFRVCAPQDDYKIRARNIPASSQMPNEYNKLFSNNLSRLHLWVKRDYPQTQLYTPQNPIESHLNCRKGETTHIYFFTFRSLFIYFAFSGWTACREKKKRN